MKPKKKKVSNYAFIDSQNLNLAIRDQGWKLDFQKFYIYLKHKFRITKAFFFIGYVDSNKKLYKTLEDIGYKLIFKPTLKDNRGKVKGNVDAELVLHTMIEYNNCDKAVIVSGDGDFYCLVEYLQKKKKLERLVIPNKYKYSSLLYDFKKIDKIVFLNSLKKKIGKRNE